MAENKWPRLVPELIVSDLNSSLAFWRGSIGFEILYERFPFRWLHLKDKKSLQDQCLEHILVVQIGSI